MKIEKINDTQVKFILTREDFKERDLTISELTYSSEKAQKLFRDMMERASIETGFEVDQSPLVIEAIPMSSDSIVIIVSKVSGKKDEEYVSPLSNLFGRLSRAENIYGENEYSALEGAAGSDTKRLRVPKNIAIYSFDTLDDASFASERLNLSFKGASSLHKYAGKYYICLQLPFKTAVLRMGELENVLCEYGDKHVSNTVSRGFLLEHGEIIINSNAVGKLASI